VHELVSKFPLAPSVPFDRLDYLENLEASYNIEDESLRNGTPDFLLPLGEPITVSQILEWHSTVQGVSGVTGKFRTVDVDVVDVQGKVYFTGPPPELVESLINEFVEWVNSPTGGDGWEKAFLAHLWFLTIHPFEDGNGRVSRIILDHLIASTNIWLSRSIYNNRSKYYDVLSQVQSQTITITKYLEWCAGIVEESIKYKKECLAFDVFVASLVHPLNARQLAYIKRIIHGQVISIRSYIKEFKVYPKTAQAEIAQIRQVL
jgi:Fic family protein